MKKASGPGERDEVLPSPLPPPLPCLPSLPLPQMMRENYEPPFCNRYQPARERSFNENLNNELIQKMTSIFSKIRDEKEDQGERPTCSEAAFLWRLSEARTQVFRNTKETIRHLGWGITYLLTSLHAAFKGGTGLVGHEHTHTLGGGSSSGGGGGGGGSSSGGGDGAGGRSRVDTTSQRRCSTVMTHSVSGGVRG